MRPMVVIEYKILTSYLQVLQIIAWIIYKNVVSVFRGVKYGNAVIISTEINHECSLLIYSLRISLFMRYVKMTGPKYWV